MQEADVAEAIETLQTQGKEPSIGNLRKVLGGGSLRDITKHRRTLLPQMGRGQNMNTASVAALGPPATPLDTPVAACASPPTLLQQAEQALREALAEERRIRRGLAEPGTPITWDDLSRVQHSSRQAQDQVNKLQRAQARLLAELPAARIEARRTAGELAVLEEDTRRRLLRARREATLAREELERMVDDLVSIAGPGAVPVETGS